ncbi:MAG: hypothetical protein ACOX34_03270 [Bacillota bacterium]|jgi:hypothetical protein
MKADAFRKLSWGFMFEMIAFRVMGIDILPDIIGFIYFGGALAILAAENERFARAKNRNLILLLFSVLQIYEPPVQESGVHFYGGPLALTLGIVISILALVHVYDIFMGIKDMAEKAGDLAVAQEADSKWCQYLALQIAVVFGFILAALPALGTVYLIGLFVGTIALAISIAGFMKRCEERLG